MKLSLAFLMTLISHSLMAQDHSDCSSAIEICNTQTFHLPSSGSEGYLNESVDEPCGLYEMGSTWFVFSFNTAGLFYFTITPSEWLTDIDFVVYQSLDNTCNEVYPVRCMGAGQNINMPIDSSCAGPTGLHPGSTDALEPPGCPSTSDSYLAALEVIPGANYYLMVLDYSQNFDDRFCTIEWFGTAELSCNSTGLEPYAKIDQEIALYPNPIINELNLSITPISDQAIHFRIFDALGVVRIEETRPVRSDVKIDTRELPPGYYFISIHNSSGLMGTIPFVKGE